MKKVVKFICLLIVAALIAILIMRNGAKADSNVTVSGPAGGITAGSNLSVTITFPYEVTSYSGGKVTAKYEDGETIERTGLTDLNGPNSNVLPVTLDGSFEKTGKVTVTVSFDMIKYKDIEAPDNCNDVTCDVEVKAKEEPDVQDFNFSIKKDQIEVDETTELVIEPTPTGEVKFTMEPNTGCITIDPDGKTVRGAMVGSTTIKATINGITKVVNVEVVEKSEPDPGPEITPSVKIGFENGVNSIKVNETVKVNATTTPSDAEVTYSSSDGNIATVDANGTVTGKSEGIAKITGKISVDGTEYSDELSITVTADNSNPDPGVNPPVEGETPRINPNGVELEAFFKSTTVKSSIPVTWRSSNSDIAAVETISDTEARIISGNTAGNCDIIATAKEGGKTSNVHVTVVMPKDNDTKVPSIFPSTDFQLGEGASITMTADIDVTWSSDNTSVATIDTNSGALTARSAGTAKITATSKSNGKTATVNVTVIAQKNGDDSGNNNSGSGDSEVFALTPSKAQTLKVGATLQLKANKPVASWQSSKPNVASVDKNGKVTAVGAGTAYISAVSIDSTAVQLKITVKEDGSVSKNTTGNATSSNSSSEVDENVPETGESTTEMLIILGVVTLAVSAMIFRKKTK